MFGVQTVHVIVEVEKYEGKFGVYSNLELETGTKVERNKGRAPVNRSISGP